MVETAGKGRPIITSSSEVTFRRLLLSQFHDKLLNDINITYII